MTDPVTGAAQEGQPQFSIQKLYLKDVSFETKNTPEVFTNQWNPDIEMQLGTGARPINKENHLYEIVLNITVTAKQGDATAFLVEIQQAGIFALAGFSDGQLGGMLGSFCPNVLFPFAREAVADLIGRGGFPPVYLAPINFDALYAQQLEKMKEEQGQKGAAEVTH